MPLPTFDTHYDDDPRLETSGITEIPIDDAEQPETPAAVAEKPVPKPDAEPVVLKEPDVAPEQDAAAVAAPTEVEAPAAAAEAEPEKADPFIPQVSERYFDLPQGAPIKESFDERRADAMDPDGIQNTVDRIVDEEAFLKEAEAHMALSQGKADADYPDWIRKPDVWPSFITFPSRRDLDAIRVAEEKGKLDDERKEKFNEHFERMSILMQERARQIDAWILAENDEIFRSEKNRFGFLKSYVKKDIEALRKDRASREAARDEALDAGRDAPQSDPFFDVKWAILLDPQASPDDPRFADVARWGHGTAVMLDKGALRVDDDGIRVPPLDAGSAMAGKMAVLEAIERGWTSIDIAGSPEFVQSAREMAIQAGLGAKITTYYGFSGKSKPEFIMPKPPKLSGIETPSDEAKEAHADLVNGEGQAPADGAEDPLIEGGPSQTSGRKLTAPGATGEAEAGVESPFDDEDDAEDKAALARLKASEAEEDPAPM